jgi:hypothetical protein
MSSGYLNPQKKGDHQVILFTFVGRISIDEKKFWNKQILALKKKFGNRLVAVTIKGDPTPPNPGT